MSLWISNHQKNNHPVNLSLVHNVIATVYPDERAKDIDSKSHLSATLNFYVAAATYEDEVCTSWTFSTVQERDDVALRVIGLLDAVPV